MPLKAAAVLAPVRTAQEDTSWLYDAACWNTPSSVAARATSLRAMPAKTQPVNHASEFRVASCAAAEAVAAVLALLPAGAPLPPSRGVDAGAKQPAGF